MATAVERSWIHKVVCDAFQCEGLWPHVADAMAARLLQSDFGLCLRDWIAQDAPMAEQLQLMGPAPAFVQMPFAPSQPFPPPVPTFTQLLSSPESTGTLPLNIAPFVQQVPLPDFQFPTNEFTFPVIVPAATTALPVSIQPTQYVLFAQLPSPPPAGVPVHMRDALYRAVLRIDLRRRAFEVAESLVTKAKEQHNEMNTEAARPEVNEFGQADELGQSVKVLDKLNKLCRDFRQISDDACTALRLLVNLFLLDVSAWKDEQRTSANWAETREKRKKKGRYVKCLPKLTEALKGLRLHTSLIGELLVRMHRFLTKVQEDAQETLGLSTYDCDPVKELHQSLLRTVGQLIQHTLIIYNHPMQVDKKGNLFALSAEWLGGQVAAQFCLGTVTLRARFVPQGDDLLPDFGANAAPYELEVAPQDHRILMQIHDDTRQQFYMFKLDRCKWIKSSDRQAQSEQTSYVVKKRKHRTIVKKTSMVSAVGESTSEREDEGEQSLPSQDSGATEPEDFRNTNRLHFVVIESDPLPLTITVGKDLMQHLLKPIRAVSLPMVLIVGLLEEELAAGTIFWRNPFGSRTEASWRELKREFSALFYGKTSSYRNNADPRIKKRIPIRGRGLPDEQQEYLRQYYEQVNGNSYGTQTLSYHAVKNNLISTTAEETFSLWAYLFRVLKMITENDDTLRLWNERAIYGFVSKDGARNLLRQHVAPLNRSGMLVRFSDGQPGAVSLVRFWQPLPNEPSYTLEVVAPWKREKLKEKPLLRRLLDWAQRLELLLSPDDAPDASPLVRSALQTIDKTIDGAIQPPPRPPRGYDVSDSYSVYCHYQRDTAFTLRSLYESGSDLAVAYNQ